MYPHRIRLRGPWDCEPLERLTPAEPPLSPKLTMTLPCRWGEGGLEGFAGRVRYQRRFGWPSRLDEHEHVWLTFAGVEGTTEISLNGTHLGRREATAGPFELEVTALLRTRNQLAVDVEAATDRGGLWGEVALEVRGPAYLRDVRAALTRAGGVPRLDVRGAVVGTWARPLELYALLDDANLIYATVEAAASGRPFHLVSEGLAEAVGEPHPDRPEPRHEVRVELVNGATVWYRVEGTLAGHGEAAETGVVLQPPA